MPVPPEASKVRHERRLVMGMVFTFIVIGFVIAVLLVVAFSLFEMSPFGRHKDHYRDPATGSRRWNPPNLEDGHY
jgi:hypothetical protein